MCLYYAIEFVLYFRTKANLHGLRYVAYHVLLALSNSPWLRQNIRISIFQACSPRIYYLVDPDLPAGKLV